MRGWSIVVLGAIVSGLMGSAACRSAGARATSDAGAAAGGANSSAEARTTDARATDARAAETAGTREARRAMVLARVPGVAFAAVTRDREPGIAAVGIADTARGTDATGETVFEAASIAKVIVATCVMQLVEEGKLELDADVARYVGFPVRHPRWPEAITLRMLLTHRASIRDRQDELGARAEGNPLGAFLKTYLVAGDGPRAAAFLGARPGSAMEYSNVGAALAAFVVERASGESFASVSARRVLAPLRMTSTSWTSPSSSQDVAVPHAYRDGGFVALPPPSHAVYPSVDLRSSARDLARFARAILRDGELDGARILSAASVRAMLHGDGEQALAWQLRSIGGARVAGHEGEDAGATTALFLDVAAGAGAVVLANGDAFGSGDEARASAIQTLMAELLAVARAR